MTTLSLVKSFFISQLLCRRMCTWHYPSAHNELSLKLLINSRNQQVCLYCLFSLSWICQDRLDCCQGHSICCKWMKRYLVDFFRTGLQKSKTGAYVSVQWQIKSASRSYRVFLSEPLALLSKIHIRCREVIALLAKAKHLGNTHMGRNNPEIQELQWDRLGHSSLEISKIFTGFSGGRSWAVGSCRNKSSSVLITSRWRQWHPPADATGGSSDMWIVSGLGLSGWCALEAFHILGFLYSWGVILRKE